MLFNLLEDGESSVTSADKEPSLFSPNAYFQAPILV